MAYIKGFAMAAVLASGLELATGAAATPLPFILPAGDAAVQTIAFGCGPGFHPNPWGICRPNWGWRRPRFYGSGWGYYHQRPYYRSYGYYGPRRYW